jgi:hypothetical protein
VVFDDDEDFRRWSNERNRLLLRVGAGLEFSVNPFSGSVSIGSTVVEWVNAVLFAGIGGADLVGANDPDLITPTFSNLWELEVDKSASIVVGIWSPVWLKEVRKERIESEVSSMLALVAEGTGSWPNLVKLPCAEVTGAASDAKCHSAVFDLFVPTAPMLSVIGHSY